MAAGPEAHTTETLHADTGVIDPALVREAPVPPAQPGIEIPLEQGLDKPAYWRPKTATISTYERDLIGKEHGRTIGDQIEASAEVNGHAGDVQGLRLEMANGESFVVRDSYTTQRPITEMKMVSHYTDEPGGIETFLPTLTETRTQKVPALHQRPGKRLPGINMKGVLPRVYRHKTDQEPQMSLFNKKPGDYTVISRRREGLGHEPTDMVTVEIYDDIGEVTGLRTMKRDDLYALAGEFGVGRASWEDRRTTETRDVSTTRIKLIDSINTHKHDKTEEEEKHPKAFDQITDQLETIGITNWTGLTWERHSPGETPGSSIVQEITLDTAVKDWDYDKPMWGRYFVVRTTHTTSEGTTVSEKVMTDGDLKHYLETADSRLTINNMRYMHREETEPAPAPPEDPLARWYWEEERAWEGLIPEDRKRIPEPAEETDKFDEPTLEDAYELLSFREQLEQKIEQKYGPQALQSPEGKQVIRENLRHRMKKLMESTEDRRYAQELKSMLNELGIDKLTKFADDIKNTYLENIMRLNMEPGLEDISLTPVIRLLIEKRWISSDVFADNVHGVKSRRDIIDRLVGQKFRASVSKLSKPSPAPTGKVNKESGQPTYESKREYDFNEDLWPVLSVIKKGTIKKRRDSIWGRIEKKAHEIHERNVKVLKGEPVDRIDEVEEARELGRMLRRTLGE